MRRGAMERLWTDTCHIYEYLPYEKKNGATGHRAARVLGALPCRISFQALAPAVETDVGAAITQQVKLFLGSEHRVEPGSKVVVLRNGRPLVYQCSGPPAVYRHHQEIPLSLFRGWA